MIGEGLRISCRPPPSLPNSPKFRPLSIQGFEADHEERLHIIGVLVTILIRAVRPTRSHRKTFAIIRQGNRRSESVDPCCSGLDSIRYVGTSLLRLRNVVTREIRRSPASDSLNNKTPPRDQSLGCISKCQCKRD